MNHSTEFSTLLQSLLQQQTSLSPTFSMSPTDKDMQDLAFWQTQSFRADDVFFPLDKPTQDTVTFPVPLQYDTPATIVPPPARQGKNSAMVLKQPLTTEDKAFAITDESILSLISKTHKKPKVGVKRPLDDTVSVVDDDVRSQSGDAVDRHVEKRRRNTEASARFRQKKKQKELELATFAQQEHDRANGLEKRVNELEKEVDVLKKLLLEKYPFQCHG
jgi:hypothetical protein